MTSFRSMIAGDAGTEVDRGEIGSEPVILLIDLDRRLLDANRAGEALLDQATMLENSFGRLVAKSQSDMARIGRVLTEARWRGVSSLRLAGGNFEAEVVRMGQNRPTPSFLVLSRQSQVPRGAERATQRFGLTPAEHRLLHCLIEGLALKDAALRLGVARTTARTHLQRIFDKTGVRRQTDLQRMIARS